ncbi:MAG TPA: tetratricopeptide repeat protein [Candidatus Acidoferrales bacterium]|nr:tetratricopeptide repeat protein [Candidatus Acidoferrales bacterium]
MRFYLLLLINRFVVCSALILSFQQLHPLLAQSSVSSFDLESMINSTIENTYNYEFRNAIETTNRMIESYPARPEGYLYKCGVFWKMSEEGCIDSTDSMRFEIRILIDKACQLSAAEIEKNPDDVNALFCYAGALVYRARAEAVSHNWYAVMSDGIKTRKLLEKVVAVDSNFCDAYSGLGAFNYYAARIPWYLKPIAFVLGVSGDEKEGVVQLKKAAQLGKYAKVEAAVFLSSVVYVNQGDYSDAAEIMRDLHGQFPRSLFFLRSLCRDYYEMGNYSETVYYADIALSPDTCSCHRGDIGYIRFYRGESYEKLNERSKAIADYEIVAVQNGNEYSGREAKAALEKLTDK